MRRRAIRAQGYQQESKREESFDSNFADSNFSDASYPDASFPEQNFAGPGYSPSGFTGYPESAPQTHADASFPETGYAEDASFPEDTSYAGGGYPHNEALNLDGGYGQPQAYQPYNDHGPGGMAEASRKAIPTGRCSPSTRLTINRRRFPWAAIKPGAAPTASMRATSPMPISSMTGTPSPRRR